MSSKYFSYFDNVVINNIKFKNIFKQFIINENFLNKKEIFRNYAIREGDTPETLAFKFYGDKKYYWIILLSNKMKDFIYDWPLSDNELKLLAEKLYNEGVDTGITIEDIYNDIYEDNETKREIKYLEPTLLNEFIKRMKIESEK